MPVAEISKAALRSQIVRLRRQLAHAEGLYVEMGGDSRKVSVLPPIENDDFRYMKPWHAMKKLLERGEVEFLAGLDLLLRGDSTIRNSPNPRWSYSKMIHRKLRDQTFRVNGQIRTEKHILAQPGDIISLP